MMSTFAVADSGSVASTFACRLSLAAVRQTRLPSSSVGDVGVGRGRRDQRHAARLDLFGDGEDLVAGVGADDDLGAEAIDDDVVGARRLRGIAGRVADDVRDVVALGR